VFVRLFGRGLPGGSHAPARCPWLGGVLALLGVVLTSATTASQTALSAPDATAAYLLNFARFTEWPESALPPSAPIVICAADQDVAEALERWVRGRLAQDRVVRARRLRPVDSVAECAVLYVTGADQARTAQLLRVAGSAPILTVGDTPGFARWGGGIELMLEHGRMVFMVNRAAVERTGLRLSSRLLGVARPLKD
jgi:hypothetical protein